VSLPWEQPGWRESADAWIDETLRALGIERSGEIDHMRQLPWAAVALVRTAEGDLYFKASAPSEAFEPALTLALARKRPDVVPEVVAVELRHAWMLTRDAGPQLRDLITDPPDPTVWHTLLRLYAELQIELCSSVDELLALGTPDSRPERLVSAYERLLSRWPNADPAPSTAEIDALVQRLGDAIPATLAHEEFADNNILLSDGRAVLIDWAESAVEHPFCSLVNAFRGLVDRWGFEPGASGLVRLRDIYLERWTPFAAMSDLIEVFDAAYALGMVCRALTWDRLVATLAAPLRAEYEHFVPAWLEILSETLDGKATLGT
jgi:hypothetical protein